jgi:hypothetical protein
MGVAKWDTLAKDLAGFYCADNGRPGGSIRLMAGLCFLKDLIRGDCVNAIAMATGEANRGKNPIPRLGHNAARAWRVYALPSFAGPAAGLPGPAPFSQLARVYRLLLFHRASRVADMNDRPCRLLWVSAGVPGLLAPECALPATTQRLAQRSFQ